MSATIYYHSKIDLHIHSNYSDDGEFSVDALINKFRILNMECISITDHNSVKALHDAILFGAVNEINVIPGIEIDCQFKSVNMHLLGYYIDFTKPAFAELEMSIRSENDKAFPQMIEKLSRLNLHVDSDKVLKRAGDKAVTGELIGEIVLEQEEYSASAILEPYRAGGAKSDNPYLNFYRDFFSQGKPAYVPVKYFSFNDMKDMILSANGVPVLAHPGENFKCQPEFVLEIVKEGVEGIEVYSSYHNKLQTDTFLAIAKENNLLITCGSDYHGRNKPSIEIGRYNFPPDEIAIRNGLKKYS
jgi:3',5'-nucleoside bisphosphate phosphatase